MNREEFGECCLSGDLKRINELLIERSFQENIYYGYPSFLKLIQSGNERCEEICKAVFKKYPILLLSKRNYGTFLHEAVKWNKLNLVKFMISEGSLLKKNNQGDTPLEVALNHGHLTIAKYFISLGHTFRKQDFDGNTMLHSFISETYVLPRSKINFGSLVDFFIEQNVDINKKNSRNDTAFDMAIKEGFIRLAEVLVKKGCFVKFHWQVNKNRYFFPFEKRRVKIKLPPLIKIDIFVY